MHQIKDNRFLIGNIEINEKWKNYFHELYKRKAQLGAYDYMINLYLKIFYIIVNNESDV